MVRRLGVLLIACAWGCGGSAGAPSALAPSPTAAATPSLPQSGTATPTAGATVTPSGTAGETGPVITYFGLTRPDGCQIGCFEERCGCGEVPPPEKDSEGRDIFIAQGNGRGMIVIEGKPGASGLPPGILLLPEFASRFDERPDLQILANRPLGNGSAVVCDVGRPPPFGTGGGVPGFPELQFSSSSEVTAALWDLACRFSVQPSAEEACTLDRFGNFAFLGDGTTIQYCDQVSATAAFPKGDTILRARLRDVAGNAGPAAEIVVRNPADAEDSGE